MYESAMLKWTRWNYSYTTHATSGATGIDLSEQYVLECSGYGDYIGGSVEGALNFILPNGIPDQSVYGFNGSTIIYSILITSTI
jgi:hypothetical protein